MLWKYVDSPVHDDEPYEDSNLVIGHIWNAGAQRDGIRPLYIATHEFELVNGEQIHLIRYHEIPVTVLQDLLHGD